MTCCWSKASVDVIDHQVDKESQTIILGTGRALHSLAVTQGSATRASVDFVSVAAQVDILDERRQRVQNRLSTKCQASATENVWKHQGSSGLNAIGTLLRADALDGIQEELNKDLPESRAESDSCLFSACKGSANIVHWDARLFSNVATHGSCGSYFPVIVNVGNGKLFAHSIDQLSSPECESRVEYSEWLAMPGIGFLPNDVVDMIAGDGGLLCVNGGSQPRKRNLHTPPIPHAEDYNHMLYPQQSILIVCNPLTEELKFLPRHTNKKLEGKIACLQVLKSNGPGRPGEKNASKSSLRYRIHVVGGHHERSSLRCPASDELVLMTYDSRSDTWISGMAVGRSRIPAFAKTGIARQEEGFYLGGQEEIEEATGVKRHTIQRKGTKWMSTRGQYQTAAVDRGRGCLVWTNKIFYVQASTLKWHSVDFEILDEDGFPHPEPLQAPRVVQCETGGPVYAVTRAAEAAKTIEIYEVVIVNGFPTGEFIPVTKMPGDIFMNLFESEISMREYDCAAGNDFICFLVDPPNQSTIGMCDLRRQKWFMSILPADPSGTGHYALGKSTWTPSCRAQP